MSTAKGASKGPMAHFPFIAKKKKKENKLGQSYDFTSTSVKTYTGTGYHNKIRSFLFKKKKNGPCIKKKLNDIHPRMTVPS